MLLVFTARGEHKNTMRTCPSLSLSLSYPDSASYLLPHHHCQASKSVTWLWAQPIQACSLKLQISMRVTVTACLIRRVLVIKQIFGDKTQIPPYLHIHFHVKVKYEAIMLFKIQQGGGFKFVPCRTNVCK